MKKIFIVRLISLISVFIFSFITLINVNTVKADNIFDKKEVFTDFNIPSKYNLENIEIKTDKNNNLSSVTLDGKIFNELVTSAKNSKTDEVKYEKLKEKIISKYVGNKYKLVNDYESAENNQFLGFALIREDGTIDSANGIAISIAKGENPSVVLFIKNDKHILDRKVNISKEEALKIVLDKYKEYKPEELTVTLSIETYMDKKSNTLKKNEKVYKISAKDKDILINPENGEILDELYYKSVSPTGRAIASTDPGLYYQLSSINHATAKMNSRLNYAMWGQQHQGNIKNEFLTAIAKNGFRAIYVSCHGNDDSNRLLGYPSNYTNDLRSWDLPSTLKLRFVFLDACSTAKEMYWANACGIFNSSQNRVFMGWKRSIGILDSWMFTYNFFNNVGTTSIYYTAILTQATTNINNNIKIYGDLNYNGSAML